MRRVAIEAPDDPRVSDYRAVREPDLVRGRGLFVAEGRVVVERLLAAGGFDVRSFLLSEAAVRALEPLIERYAPDVPVYVCSAAGLEQVAGFALHRGCLALVARPAPTEMSGVVSATRTLVIIEGVGNPDNVGAIFRNAAALDAAILLGPSCADPLYRKAIRTSMAATLTVPHAAVPAWPEGLDLVRAAGFDLWALTPHRDAVSLEDAMAAKSSRRVGLLVGAEGDGLTPAALDAADLRIRIPMADGADSINVAVATGIALYRLACARRA